MKFIEIVAVTYDENIGEDSEGTVLMNLDNIIGVENKLRRVYSHAQQQQPRDVPDRDRGLRPPRRANEGELVLTPRIISTGDNYWVLNYSYEDLKRILSTNGNVRMSGGSV